MSKFTTTLRKAVETCNGMQIGLDKVTAWSWSGSTLWLETEAEDEYVAEDRLIEINEHGFATIKADNLGNDSDDEDIEVQFLMYRPMRQEDLED